ncbi:MAG TPA: histidine phosphatase family protein [Gemmatimonadaceae bacterium]|nr:histidine phosphatase family protein [Gemmatimonadaceae bacterium]
MTQRRILLVRHGHSSHNGPAGWMDAADVLRWRDAYDAAGILDDSHPSPSLVAEVAAADRLIASDLPRAIASAERLAPGKAVSILPLVREMYLDLPRWLVARWPLKVWEIAIYLHWTIQELRQGIATPEEIQRAVHAVAALEESSRDAATIAVVTHGAFRRLLALRLMEQGWSPGERTGGFSNWSVWRYHAPGA